MTQKPLTSRRPYLIRALHEWMTDNHQTPHLVVDALSEGVDVPKAYVRDGRIILNVSWTATQGLKLGNDWIEFSARFGGTPAHLRIPARAVLGIYARETGQGMIFQDEGDVDPPPPAPTPPEPAPPAGDDARRARFRVVK